MVETIAKSAPLTYTGEHQPQAGETDPQTGQRREPYLPDENLVEAVNLAILLGRPLLIKGEPGCGKTKLATAVAYELGLPFETWYIKSTSRAKDGLYTYDAVGRLRDAQLASAGQLTKAEDIARISNPATYVKMGPLGRAFQSTKRHVVLIDEIDKADIDFPNDLLLELDEQRFIIDETGQEIRAQDKPIVFITSNDEKDLPDAFLRRCLFHYLKFPSPERLSTIVGLLFPSASSRVVEQAIARFSALRQQMITEKGNAGKKVSTSELIDWFYVLQRHSEEEALAKLNGTLPYAEVLLKSWEDHRRYLSQAER